MAAVDPAAVETLRPLDRVLIKLELVPLLPLILNREQSIFAFIRQSQNKDSAYLEE